MTALSIAGDPPSGCSGPGGNASSSPRLLQIAAETDGAFGSICSRDWSGMLRGMSDLVAGGRRIFRLRQGADPASVVVRLDGRTLAATDWVYRADIRAIEVPPSGIPEPGSTLEVEYSPACP